MQPIFEEPDDLYTWDEKLDAALGITSPTQWASIVDVHVLLRRGGPEQPEVLLVHRANTGFCDGMWSAPSGRLRPLESVVRRAMREARESLMVEVNPGDLEFAHVTHHRSDTERIGFFFAARTWRGEPVNAEPHEHDAIAWFPLGCLPGETLPCSAAGIRHYREGRPFSLHNWEP